MSLQLEEQAVEDLLSIVYSSVAAMPFSELDLASLLAQSRMNNDPSGLSGMLLYRDGQFMQVLEGPTAAVRATFRRIAADPRHTGVWTLDEETIGERRFATWAMGYRDIADDEPLPAAWYGSPEAADGLGGRLLGARASELLTWFREH